MKVSFLTRLLLWIGVDCSQPEEIENGRVFLVNGTTVFASLVEYHCLPGYQRSGHFSRKCGADARWTGIIPVCVGKILNHQFIDFVNENELIGLQKRGKRCLRCKITDWMACLPRDNRQPEAAFGSASAPDWLSSCLSSSPSSTANCKSTDNLFLIHLATL